MNFPTNDQIYGMTIAGLESLIVEFAQFAINADVTDLQSALAAAQLIADDEKQRLEALPLHLTFRLGPATYVANAIRVINSVNAARAAGKRFRPSHYSRAYCAVVDALAAYRAAM